MVYTDRRFAQNGADASSLGGGGAAALAMENSGITWYNWPCNASPPTSTIPSGLSAVSTAAKEAAISRAADDSFTIDEDISDNHGVTTMCGAVNKVIWTDKFMDILTVITMDTRTSFAHFVYGGPLCSTVTAVTRVRPRAPLAYGYAIVALNPANCSGQSNGVGFHSTSGVLVEGGGIFSNGCIRGDEHVDVEVQNAGIFYHYKRSNDDLDEFTITSSGSPLQLSGDQNRIPPSAYAIPEPNCTGHTFSASAFEHDATDASGLAPGLYCVNGDVRFNAKDKSTGNGVTIVLLNGSLTINGGAEIRWTAPVASPDPAPAISGILIYAPSTNHNTIQIAGNADSFYRGTILAPGANIDAMGTGGTEAFQSQLIGWNVEVGGTSDTHVVFDNNNQYSRPTYIELNR
jgi:hypothetical protein